MTEENGFVLSAMKWFGCPLMLSLCSLGVAQGTKVESIKPSDADPRVKQFDDPSLVIRPMPIKNLALIVFLPGTSGIPAPIPMLRALSEKGYPIISLEYNNEPAIQQVCPADPDPYCSTKLRRLRTFGDRGHEKLGDSEKAETIVVRLTMLLQLLKSRHPGDGWEAYLAMDGAPKWANIIISGQSQGAGMAAMIGKALEMQRVVLFSSPIDNYGVRKTPAPWLKAESKTPMSRWYAERNKREVLNAQLINAYRILGIRQENIRVFALEVPEGEDSSNRDLYHTVNIRDGRYLLDWYFLFGVNE